MRMVWSVMRFGPEYILPKPFDPRVLVWEASAVAQGSDGIRSGERAGRYLEEYRERLEMRMSRAHEVMRMIIHKARAKPKRVVFPEGEADQVLRASHILVGEAIARPILLGSESKIRARAAELDVSLEGMEIVDPNISEWREVYTQELYWLRQRRGVTLNEARRLIDNPNYFASLMVHMGNADALVSGITQHYPDTIRPALQVIQMREGVHRVSGLYVLVTRKGDVYFLADCAVNIDPSAEDLAEIALCSAEVARRFEVVPRVAMLSFSNFGAIDHPECDKMRKATALVKQRDPALIVDGEIMPDAALNPEVLQRDFPFSTLKSGANVLIFPNLAAANIAYRLLVRIGGAEALGPILMGMNKPAYVLPHGIEVEDIVNIAALAVVEAEGTKATSDAGQNLVVAG
jgi:malate dehydrogenase (oxaloacetate-decarboxylating)(NADP+)